jgi:pyruvate carboxylase subunit B
MKRDIQLCLVYRDMWQSAGKYMPRVDQLLRIAEPIIEMGCFTRVETNGGGFEQICLLFGENPNEAVRAWTKPFREASIQTQMLERGLNALRMSPAPLDTRRLMFQVKSKQGVNVSRSFDGLNNLENLAPSFRFARESGMIAQGALCITHSPVHTDEYFIDLADRFLELGAEEICLKDMAGVGRPAAVGRVVKGIRERHPKVIIQYHTHATPGFSVASALEAARNGADIIDVGMTPLSWGTGHSDLLTIHAMLRDAGFSLPDVNQKAYMRAVTLNQEFIDDYLGLFINPRNHLLNALLIGPGLPGGMMGSLMADLESNLRSLNKWLVKQNKPEMSQDDLLLRLFEEVEHAWPRLGYPPLVTPYSQYVKNVALMNAVNVVKGKKRWDMIDENTWDMILGKAGKLPGPVGEEIVELAKQLGKSFYEGNPQDLYEDQLPEFREKMKEKGWSFGPDEEELMQYAMHPNQYEEYRSGKAKARFEEEVDKRKAARAGRAVSASSAPPPSPTPGPARPRTLTVDVNGEKFRVTLLYEENEDQAPGVEQDSPAPKPESSAGDSASDNGNGQYSAIIAPLEGKFYLTRESSEKPVKVGDYIKAGDTVAYIESMKVINAITADKSGVVTEILAQHGQDVEEDDIIFKLK